jgi:hypothetical protein
VDNNKTIIKQSYRYLGSFILFTVIKKVCFIEAGGLQF